MDIAFLQMIADSIVASAIIVKAILALAGKHCDFRAL
jgi:hypothetical protein